MPIPENIRHILEAAIRAPSGENSQPWHFSVKETASEEVQIEVKISETRDQSLYGWGNRASYLALGAALENMRIASLGAGLSLSFTLLPNHHDSALVAKVRCVRNLNKKEDPLEKALFERCTNRKPYKIDPLSSEDFRGLIDISKDMDYGEIHLTANKIDMKTLAIAGAANERIMLANKTAHHFFFSHVNWTRQEDELKKSGFFIDTLELPPPAQIGFKIMRTWERARFLNRFLRFNVVASSQNAKNYSKAAAIGVITAPHESPEGAIRSGMLLERLWLEATKRDLSFQPIAGLLYFYLRIKAGETDGFTNEEQNLVKEKYADIERIFSTKNKTIYFMFRVGKGAPPSARSVRFPLEDVVSVEK